MIPENPFTAPRYRVSGLLLFLIAVLFAGPAAGQHLSMTADEVIGLARTGVGHAYHWDHGNWTPDGSNIGTCTGKCPSCTFKGKVGADCSGFVAKAWQVPEPMPVELDSHPYSTAVFASPQSMHPWVKVTDTVRRGDALVKYEIKKDKNGKEVRTGHIVLVDQVLGNGRYVAYHASGCKKGIIHDSGSWSTFSPIRRDDVTDAATKTCNGHGTFGDDKTCHCSAGFAGDDCERCKEGFVRYPTCAAASCGLARKNGNSSLQGTLNCGSTYTFKLKGGGNHQTEYGCGPKALAAEEVGFQFRPPGVGIAKLVIESDADVSMMLTRHDCAPDSCIMSAKDSLELSFGGDDEFYVIVDAPSVTNENVTIKVECEVPRSTWIGDSCSVDDDCPSGRYGRYGATLEGFCHQGPAGSFCSTVCDSSGKCPDLINAAPTTCVADPNGERTSGICLAKPDPLNLDCGTVPGTKALEKPHRRRSSTVNVCYPVEDPGACIGSFRGMVVDAGSGAAVEGATVKYGAVSGEKTAITDALGRFMSEDMPCGSHEFLVEASNFSPKTVGAEVHAALKDIGQVRLQSFADQCVPATTEIDGVVRNSITDNPIENALVELREGAGVSSGEAVASATTGPDGAFSFPGLVLGDFTISATAEGFVEGGRTTVTVCEDFVEEKDVFLTPDLSDAEHSLRFVLTWDQPEDLDLHLLTPSGDDVFFWETCRGVADEAPFATLDVDHYATDGPEAITLSSLMPGRYELFVHNFAAHNWQEPELEGTYQDNPVGLQQSGAEVTVYDGSGAVIDRFSVPSSGTGFFWNVLSVQTGADGAPEIRQVQTLTSSRRNPFSEYAGECNPF